MSQPSSLTAWLEENGILELEQTLQEQGFKTVMSIVESNLTDADLRSLGIEQMKVRKDVLRALAKLGAAGDAPMLNLKPDEHYIVDDYEADLAELAKMEAGTPTAAEYTTAGTKRAAPDSLGPPPGNLGPPPAKQPRAAKQPVCSFPRARTPSATLFRCSCPAARTATTRFSCSNLARNRAIGGSSRARNRGRRGRRRRSSRRRGSGSAGAAARGGGGARRSGSRSGPGSGPRPRQPPEI
jgi:hypothetical protein